MATANLLLVDDEEEILIALKRVFRAIDCHIFTASNGEEGLALLKRQPIDIIISDLKMPVMDGNQFLKIVANMYPDTIRLMLTGYAELNHVLMAVNEGRIWGYMQKPWNNRELLISIEQALKFKKIAVERKVLKKTVERYQETQRPVFEGFIGESIPMQFVYKSIEQSAPSSASVFITGPSGSGKEVAAEAIHHLSQRKNGPFFALNCAAIPHELMESEIFGHVKGAFSGASHSRDGAATIANGGTLFLDELGEMDMGLQAKLLRFIQTGTFQKVGSDRTEKVDIRFISATNRNPFDAIAEHKLREDLYYRLNVICIDLPPLCERDNDIGLIASHFLEKFSKVENKVIAGFEDKALSFLIGYHWPGNVRQLQNIIHSLVIMTQEPIITRELVEQQLGQSSNVKPTSAPKASLIRSQQAPSQTAPKSSVQSKSDILSLAMTERNAIEQAIEICDDNIVQAAGLLEVSPSTLYRKMQQWQDS